MSDSRSVAALGKQEDPPVRSGLIASWIEFWFAPIDPIGLHVLRVLAGLLFLTWLLPFAGDPGAWFGLNGWFDATAYSETSRMPALPPHLFSWSILYLCGTNASLLTAAYWLSIGVLLLFTFGLWTRVTGVLTWIVVVSFTANPASAWDVDPLLRMLAFYLMFGHLLLGQMTPDLPLGNRLLGVRTYPTESVAANLALRLFQVHFAIGILANGLHKLQTQEWWRGLTFWFYCHAPFQTTIEEVQAYQPSAENSLFYFSLATYAMLAWQIGFPGFAWRRTLRPLLLGGALIAFLVSVLVLHWPLIGSMMIIGSLSYLTPAEWRWIAGRLTWVPGLREKPSERGRLARTTPAVRIAAFPASEGVR